MHLTIKDINKKLPEYKQIKKLYKHSFPLKERLPMFLMKMTSLRKLILAKAYYDNDVLCGFTYIIEQEKMLFVLYLAVNDALRGKGYGTVIINCLKEQYAGKTIFLDVEKPDADADNSAQRNKRIEFYKRNGIYETNQFFSAYGVEYEILSTNKSFTKKDYDLFWQNLFNG